MAISICSYGRYGGLGAAVQTSIDNGQPSCRGPGYEEPRIGIFQVAQLDGTQP